MRPLAFIALITATACASGGSSGGASGSTGSSGSESVHIAGSSTPLTLTSSSSALVTNVAAPIERVWLAIPHAWQTLSIPITGVDTIQYVVRNDGLKIRRQLGSTPLGRYIDCGSTQIGENADSYDVYLTVVTTLKKNANGTTAVSTLLESMAKPVNFSRDYSRCSSRGILESRVSDAIKAQLQ